MHGIPYWIVYSIGFAAQFFFAGRTIFQWLDSESKQKVTSPSAYWGLSVIAAWLMFVYGVLRDDFSIILGQFISYFVYLWNLDAKGVWKKLSILLKALLLATPAVALVLLLHDAFQKPLQFLRRSYSEAVVQDSRRGAVMIFRLVRPVLPDI